MSKTLRAVFMGTPKFAEIILEKILKSDLIEIIAAYSQPDRPAGRGKSLKAPEVKVLAQQRNIPVYQPLNFKNEDTVAELKNLEPDILIVAAYGLILPQAVLNIPKLLPINIHASLLPRYRGAAPIQRAIMNGEQVTGVSLMRMEAALDTGPILMQQAMGIDINDTSAMLHDELAETGAELLLEFISRLLAGKTREIKQNGLKSSYAPMLKKSDGDIDFSKSKEEIHSLIRGLCPWPGARAILQRDGEESLNIGLMPGIYPFEIDMNDELKNLESLKPGSIATIIDNALIVRCGNGWYAFDNLCPAGKKSMDGSSFYNGYISKYPKAYFG